MEQSMTAPGMQFSSPPQPMDVDVETHMNIRKVAITVLACGRFKKKRKFNYLLEVDAKDLEEPEQALADIFSNARLDEQASSSSSSQGSVIAYGQRGLCTGHPEAQGEVIPLPPAADSGFLSSQGYYAAAQQERGESSHQVVGGMVTLPNPATDFLRVPHNKGYTQPDQEKSGPYEQVVREMFTPDSATTGFLYAPSQGHCFTEADESVNYKQRIQEIEKLLDDPDVSCEGLKPPASVGSDWRSLKILLEVEGNSQRWVKLASDLKDDVTKKIQDLEAGSGRAKVHKLVEDAEEIIKKLENTGATSEGKTRDPKATSTLPTIRETEQYLSDVFEKLQANIIELTNGLGRQKQHTSLAAMSRLIETGRKALRNLGRGTESITEKLNTLKKDLKFRGLTVDKHFQKCAESIPALVQSILQKQQGNFLSVFSVLDWYLEEKSSGQFAKD